MPTLIIDQTLIPRLLPMPECIGVMEDALGTLARDDALLPLRSMIRLPGGPNVFALMPAWLGAPSAVGAKIISVFPDNHGTPWDSHQGIVLLFETTHGRLEAILDATSITAIRTAAVSGLATRLLAREDAHELAILGAGVQGRSHVDAMCAVRSISRLRVWSRTREHATALAHLAEDRFGVRAEAVPSAEAAVREASVVCTTTSSREPVLRGEWLAPGAHVNAVGACFPSTRELDTEAVRRARLYVDRRESALSEAGDILIPMDERAFAADHIVGELGEVIVGRVAGRRGPEEITLFKSLGIAVEDLAAAHHIHGRALEEGLGVSVQIGGARHAAH